MTTVGVRLPSQVRPLRYDITLTPNLSDFSFQGEETIRLEVNEQTNTVTLHAIELKVSSASLSLGDGRSIAARNIQMDERHETATFTFGQQLPMGQVNLLVRFTGTLNDQLRGFY